jgi:type IV pilus assembly protein PilA
MYRLAAGYFFLYPLALLILLAIVSAVLGEAVGALFYWVGIIAGLVVVPMFANAIYHWHVRKRIDKLAADAPSHEALVQRLIGQSSGGSPAVVAIACVVAVFFVGILAAIAIPAYQDYTIRSQITEGLQLATAVKAAVAASRSAPSDLQSAIDTARHVDSIEVSDGTILIRYGKTAHRSIAGHTLSLHPASIGDDIDWACGYAAGEATATDIAPGYLPSACRASQVERL